MSTTTTLPATQNHQQPINIASNNNHQHEDDVVTALPIVLRTARATASTNASSLLLQSLLDAVRNVQTAYGGHRHELATDRDGNVTRLCDLWDSVLSHGLRAGASAAPAPHQFVTATATSAASALLQSVADRVHEAVAAATATATNQASSTSSALPSTFWSFALPHLTAHERDRFHGLQLVRTDYGRGRALLRAALNERSLERYLLVWLNAPQLREAYASDAVLRDPEATNLLPSIAAGLAAILFAVPVDVSRLDGRIGGGLETPEPIIVAPPRTQLVRAMPARRRQLVSFEPQTGDGELMATASTTDSDAEPMLDGSPRTLSSMCLINGRKPAVVVPPMAAAGAVGTGGSWQSTQTPLVAVRPFEAVFDMQPELPSEIVEVPRVVATETAGRWEPPIPEIQAELLVRSETPEAPADVKAEYVEPDNNNQQTPPKMYRLISEDNELAEYLADQVAQEQQQQQQQQQQQNDQIEYPTDVYNDTGDTTTADYEDEVEAKSSASSARSSGGRLPDEATADGGAHCVEQLRERLHHLTERCTWLENRVASLSLENHRLRGRCEAPAAEHAHFGLTIPRVYVDTSSGRRPFYVYEVRVVSTAAMLVEMTATAQRRVEWSVLRRYSEFNELHRKYRRLSGAVRALEFPPKKHFGNMDAKFVELRRQQLQVYIRQFFAVLPESRTCVTRVQLQHVLPFFNNNN